MHSVLSAAALALSLHATYTTALGVNCRGSFFCGGVSGIDAIASTMLNTVDQTLHYNNGDHIACVTNGQPNATATAGAGEGFCAFVQGTQIGANGDAIVSAFQLLQAHGCHGCGSEPFDTANNSPDQGILTVNFVNEMACEDLPCFLAPGFVGAKQPSNPS